MVNRTFAAAAAAVLLLAGQPFRDAHAADPPAPVAAPPAEPADDSEAPEKPEREPSLFDSGRLLATSGVSQIEGAGGGGLVPWALITGYGTRNAVGGNVHYTYVGLSNFSLQSAGAAIGLFDRVEISLARQEFDSRTTGAKLGFGRNFSFNQNILGAKVRLFGDAIYDQDSWVPQVAAGFQYKENERGVQVRAVGAKDRDGADFYLAATKLFLGQNLLLNVTLRETKANQYGILGFGGDRNDSYTIQYEGSAAYLISRQLAVGAEYRTKPSNLGAANEQNAYDVFLAYFFNKNLSATAAFVDLGDIATEKNQRGFYLSVQAGF